MSNGYEFRPDMPKHAQIAEDLRTRIRRGEFPPRSPLPSEAHIVQHYGVARITARKAIATLREAGYVRTVNGMGSYVRDRSEWPADDGN
jgi:DNA-binding GntR family transcriptional regulator